MPKCPVCQNSQVQKSQCSLCSWNLTVYSLTPNGLKQERKNRFEWSKRIWKELQALKEAIDDLRDEYQYLIEQEQESVDELQEFLESEQVKFHQKIKELETNAEKRIKELEEKIEYFLSEPNRIAEKRNQLSIESDDSKQNDRKLTTTLPTMKIAEIIKKNAGYREVDEWLRNCAIDAAIKEGWFNE